MAFGSLPKARLFAGLVIFTLVGLQIHLFSIHMQPALVGSFDSDSEDWPELDHISPYLGEDQHLPDKWRIQGTIDPKYQGEVVEGWPPGRDRNLSHYIGDHFYTYPCTEDAQDLDRVKLLIAVKASPARVESRMVNREILGAFQRDHPSVKVLNFIGKSRHPALTRKVINEQQSHCDIVNLDFYEHYNNITLKLVSIVKFVHENDLGLRPYFTFVMDDDSFLNLPQLYQLLTKSGLVSPNDLDMLGYLYSGGPGSVMRPKADSKDTFTLPSVLPFYMYNGTSFPPFLSGSGYILPRAVIPCLATKSLLLPFFHIDDVFITGFLGESCGFLRTGMASFKPGQVPVDEANPLDVLFHYQDIQGKKKLFAKFSNKSISTTVESSL